MSEITCLILSVVLWVAHVLTQAVTARAEFGDAYLFSPRDKQLLPKGLVCGRAARAFANYTENYVPFAAMALALIATGHTGGMGAAGATIWILARIVYLPVYVMGVVYVRSVLWGAALVGLLMMLVRLATA